MVGDNGTIGERDGAVPGAVAITVREKDLKAVDIEWGNAVGCR